MPTRQEIINYITQAALKRGIDPAVVLRVVQQESSFNPAAANDKTTREKSYGLFQLNVQGGLGVEARKRGIEPTDPNQWKQHVDFSLDTVKRDGWRQWGGARDTGTKRWAGVNSISDTGRTKTPKFIDIGDEPTLQNLSSPKMTLKQVNPAAGPEGIAAQIARQTSPTEPEQVSEMARPSVKDAIRQSMDELGIKDQLQYAGFVPPGLTRGSTATRRAANRGVQPKGTMKDVEAEKMRAEELRNVPNADKQMEGDYADYVRKEQARMRGEKGGEAQPSTAVQIVDNNLAAQNDPARQALIAAKIRGYANPNSGGPPPPPGGTSNTTTNAGPGGGVPNAAKAAAAGTAVAAGVSAGLDGNERVQQGHDAANRRAPQGANVDPGVAQMEKQLNLPPGTLSSPQAGMVAMSAIPIMKEVMSDPQTAPAAMQVVKKIAQVKAQKDALQADMQSDPTYYQKRAAMGQAPGAMQDDRAMERAVMMDNQRRMMGGAPSARGVPQGVPQAAAQQQTAQPQGTTKGTVSVRPTTEQDIVNQNLEKGDVPPQVAQTPQPPPVESVYTKRYRPTEGGAADPRGAEGYPLSPGSGDVTGGIPRGVPSSGQIPMDPVMMQLMQFFSGGGNVG